MKKIFIGGSRKISRLNKVLKNKLDNIIYNEYTILVGDANGADKSVQKYLFNRLYDKVIVYCMDSECRNNIGNWNTRYIFSNISNNKKDFTYYSLKDSEMVKDSDLGFMLWDGKSKGTFNNIINLLKIEKMVIIYHSMYKKLYCFNNYDEFKTCFRKDLNNFRSMQKHKLQKDLDFHAFKTGRIEMDIREEIMKSLDILPEEALKGVLEYIRHIQESVKTEFNKNYNEEILRGQKTIKKVN